MPEQDPPNPPNPTPPPAPPAPSPGPTEFTPEQQARVDQIVRDRLARQQTRLDELEAAKTELDQIKAANATDLEKATTAATDAKAEADRLRQEINGLRRQTAITAAAVKAGAVDPDAVAQLLPADAVPIGADGTVDAAAAEAAVNTLLEQRTYLRAPAAPPAPAPSNPAGPQGDGEVDLEAMSIDDYVAGKHRTQ